MIRRILLLLACLGFAASAAADERAPATYGGVLQWYFDAAEAGDVDAQFALGLQFEQGLLEKAPDLALAAQWYAQAADNGHALAQLRLALLLLSRGDAAEAARYMESAALQGVAEAQFDLALMLEIGRGVAPDEDAALRWYRAAAAQGMAAACHNLGGLLAGWRNAPADDVDAYMWLERAARAGVPEAPPAQADLARRMTPALVAEAVAAADAHVCAPVGG